MEAIVTILACILAFGLLVFVHELGHFLAAKLAGVKVEEFSFAFGPKIVSKKWGDTVYSIRAIPLGGYVRLEGEQGSESNSPTSYANKPLRSKVFILSAGVIMNFILACVLSIGYLAATNYKTTLSNIVDYDFVGAQDVQTIKLQTTINVTEIADTSPATGLLNANDLIIELNGEPISSGDDFATQLQSLKGQTVTLTTLDTQQLELHDVKVNLPQVAEGEPVLQVTYAAYESELQEFYLITYPASVFAGVSHSTNLLGYLIKAMGVLVGQSIAERNVTPIAEQAGGVVLVGALIGDIVSAGDALAFINLLAVISISLAFANVLPIPLLDGGQIAIETIQSIRRKKFSDRTISIINQIGLVVVMLLFVLVALKDIIQVGLIDNIISAVRSVLGR